ncbi:glutathione S-transferase N-terminal domain-containing protein [Candidatus Micrarchaeota archaeon]|nr:glutathione S-transferase N-terminal domain-containing protein [Candidatus Micrarchaeota archaeon]
MKQPDVKIYSTPSCVYCRLAKNYFQQQRIAYSEVDVAANPKAAEEMIEKSGQLGVPVIDIGGKIIVGFDQPAIREALGLDGIQIHRK